MVRATPPSPSQRFSVPAASVRILILEQIPDALSLDVRLSFVTPRGNWLIRIASFERQSKWMCDCPKDGESWRYIYNRGRAQFKM